MMAWYNMNRETQGKEHRVYIANQENLAAFAERAMHSSVLAIDTEFLREKTYYAKLCLIQLATDDETAIVDPFAVDDLKVLAPVLRNENVMKLFHAGNQDLEILLREVGVLPHPLFDTQVAAALLGHTQQIGYAALVHAECGVTLVDFKLEFGKVADGSIVLADEISPDTCRLWDEKTHEKLDKDRFRRDMGGVEEAYAEMMKRIGLN